MCIHPRLINTPSVFFYSNNLWLAYLMYGERAISWLNRNLQPRASRAFSDSVREVDVRFISISCSVCARYKLCVSTEHVHSTVVKNIDTRFSSATHITIFCVKKECNVKLEWPRSSLDNNRRLKKKKKTDGSEKQELLLFDPLYNNWIEQAGLGQGLSRVCQLLAGERGHEHKWLVCIVRPRAGLQFRTYDISNPINCKSFWHRKSKIVFTCTHSI